MCVVMGLVISSFAHDFVFDCKGSCAIVQAVKPAGGPIAAAEAVRL